MSRSPRSPLRVGLIQAQVRQDYAATLKNTERMVREAKARGAGLIVLEELFAGPYFCQTHDPEVFATAEPQDGRTVQAMAALARETETTLVVPFFEKRAPGLYHNSLVVIGPDGETLGIYRKMHIPEDPQFEEKFYFTPGDANDPGQRGPTSNGEGFCAFQTPEVKLGTLICWDQWFPEAARLTALRGAEVLVYPTAIGWLDSEKAEQGADQLSAWQTMQRSHAIANGVFVIAVNRVGLEGSRETGIEFWGHSFVCDPLGRVLAEGGEKEEVIIADLDLGLIEDTRKWWPFFRDRRVDAYGGLVRRWDERS
jgi:N-carbamoylputrescine amidase